MVFSSLSFMFFFLPVTLLLYFIFKSPKYRNSILLIASLVFYSWGEPKFIILILLVSFIAFLGGIIIDRYRNTKTSKISYAVTVVLLIANLFIFKYFNFTAKNFAALFGKGSIAFNIVLPIGISFYTFQILSYVIDLYNEKVSVQKNYFRLLLYVCFFPQLIAGPIVRYSTIENEISSRRESWDDINYGLKRFIVGLSKKVIIANNVAYVAETIFSSNSDSYGSVMYWLATLAYTLQIYYDFSGYSDMAIGLGRIFGFHFEENFNYPYVSTSVTEFWRRWHISLSSWFRDYVYIPMGGSRCSKARHLFNLAVVWLLTGFWHGAEWNFILWGLYYFVILIFEKYVIRDLLPKTNKYVRWVYTFFVVTIGWTIFYNTDLAALGTAFYKLFSFTRTDFISAFAQNIEILWSAVFIIPGVIFMFPIVSKIRSKINEDSFPVLLFEYFIYAVLLFICIMMLISESYNPFIYFRF